MAVVIPAVEVLVVIGKKVVVINYLQYSLAALLSLLITSLMAFAIEVPPLNSQRVIDTATLLTAQERTQIESLLADFEAKTTNQIAVLIIPTLADETIESFSNKAFRTYKLGQKDKNNGALLVIAHNDHKVRIEVGYGLEAVLPDGRTGQILREQITPKFKQNNYVGGIDAGLKEIMHIIDAKYQPPVSSLNSPPPAEKAWPILPLFLAGLATLMAAGITISIVKNRRYYRKLNAKKQPSQNNKSSKNNVEPGPRKDSPSASNLMAPKDTKAHKKMATAKKDKPPQNNANKQKSKANKNNQSKKTTQTTYNSYDHSSSYSSSNYSSSQSDNSYSSSNYSNSSSSYSDASSDSSSFSGGGGDTGGGGASSDW